MTIKELEFIISRKYNGGINCPYTSRNISFSCISNDCEYYRKIPHTPNCHPNELYTWAKNRLKVMKVNEILK